jgi:uncharacterized protein
MSLKERLQQIYGPSPASGRELSGRLEKISQGTNRRRLSEALGGDWAEGETLIVTRSLPASSTHGRTTLSGFLSLQGRDFVRLTGDEAFSDARPEEFLFLDTETTGLSGGAGTVAFLTGAAYFRDGALVLKQFFLPSFETEAAFLGNLLRLTDKENRFRFLGSFNGKGYDVQVLDTRFLLKRLTHPFRQMPHLDLLHPGRALWKERLQDCSLQSLERRILGFRRQNDFPSHLIPQAYFGYLRTGDSLPLGPILEHNRYDLISLVSLACAMAEAVDRPHHDNLSTPPAAARLLENRGCFGEAERVLENALNEGEWNECRQECMERLALLKKRSGKHLEALRLLEGLLQDHPRPSLLAFEEAAKIMEHRTGDLKRAQRITRLALQRYPGSDELKRRLHRLDCRLQGRRWWGG